MLQHLREMRAEELEGEGAGEAGFTLIELMVVLLIIAILLAIAIPTFLGVTSGANDRAAQSNLTNALTESQAVYQNNSQAFPDPAAANWPTGAGNPTGLSYYTTAAPEFTWVNGNTGGTASLVPGTISIAAFQVNGEGAQAYQGIAFAVKSKTGTCWYMIDLMAGTGGGTNGSKQTNAGVAYGMNKTPTSCIAANALATQLTGTSYNNANTIAG
jgi:prepilin-type N-terminal cleavage/methylation domain-containing protein